MIMPHWYEIKDIAVYSAYWSFIFRNKLMIHEDTFGFGLPEHGFMSSYFGLIIARAWRVTICWKE